MPGLCGVMPCRGRGLLSPEALQTLPKGSQTLSGNNFPSSLSYSHTQYQPVSQISCLDRFYIPLAWQGQKDGGFSSLFCGVQSDPQAQMGVLPGKMLCRRDTGHWCLCTYTYTYIGPNLSLSLFLPLGSLQCLFLWIIIIFVFDSLTASLMLIIGYHQSDLRPVEAGDKWNRCFVDPYNPDINSAVVRNSDQMIPAFLTYLNKC